MYLRVTATVICDRLVLGKSCGKTSSHMMTMSSAQTEKDRLDYELEARNVFESVGWRRAKYGVWMCPECSLKT